MKKIKYLFSNDYHLSLNYKINKTINIYNFKILYLIEFFVNVLSYFT